MEGVLRFSIRREEKRDDRNSYSKKRMVNAKLWESRSYRQSTIPYVVAGRSLSSSVV